MTQTAKRRTMYMHTLDGKPASMQYDAKLGAWLFFVGGRNKVKLVGSLADIRGEWNDCLDTFSAEHPADTDGREAMAELRRYGYVLVEVPK